jgi:hypothetical protein
MRCRNIISMLLAIILCSTQRLHAADLPLDKQVEFFLKVLKFDRTAMGKAGDIIRVAIVYDANNGTPSDLVSQIDDILYAKTTSGESIGDKKLNYSLFSFASKAQFEQQLHSFQISAFFIMPGNDKNVELISEVAKASGIITFSGVEGYMSRGVAVGVKDVEGKPKIVVHLPMAKEQGADLDANLLKLADIIK